MDTHTISWLFEKILDNWFWVLIILFNIFSKSNISKRTPRGLRTETAGVEWPGNEAKAASRQFS